MTQDTYYPSPNAHAATNLCPVRVRVELACSARKSLPRLRGVITRVRSAAITRERSAVITR